MTANYHTHTYRCHHAAGTEREYVERAIANGLKVLGFSDHAPYLFDGDYYSNFRMHPREVDDYCRTLEALRKEYAGQIELHIGLEMEYYPQLFDRTLDFLRDYPIEYLLLGQHFLDNEIDAFYSGHETDDESKLARYVAQVSEALQTRRFTYVAHPDLINYTGPDSVYLRHMTDLCKTAKRLDIPLELNLLGMEDHRPYPHDRFWQLVGEIGAPAVIGCDAHRVQSVGNPDSARAARAYLARFGISPVRSVELRDPFRK